MRYICVSVCVRAVGVCVSKVQKTQVQLSSVRKGHKNKNRNIQFGIGIHTEIQKNRLKMY